MNQYFVKAKTANNKSHTRDVALCSEALEFGGRGIGGNLLVQVDPWPRPAD